MNASRDMRSTFGPYSRLFEIGRGGMATVYRATAPDGNLVALKLLGIHLAADKTAISRFKTESQLNLDHPNIVRVNNASVIDDTPFIEMEYVPGESLDRLILRQGPLTPAQLSPILDDAARALDYAHSKGVVHRDVKPSNILIRADGRAMLADFGVAKAANITAYTATAARVGSVFYMSPEQAAGAYSITKSTDVYSLGVTAYYALSGRHPFEGDNDVAIARQHVDQLPPHLSVVNPRVPRAVGDVVMRALEKNPARRPASAGAFAAAFAAALSAPEVIAPPIAPVQSAPLPAESTPAPANPADVAGGGPIPRSTWLLVGTVTGFALLLLAAGIFFALLNGSTQPPRATSAPDIGVVATASPALTVESVLTPIATIIVQTVPPTAGATIVFVVPTAIAPATTTPIVINPIIPSPTPVVFPTLPPVLPTAPPPPPTWTPAPTWTALPPTLTSIPPTATVAPPTPTAAPTDTPLSPTNTPPVLPTDTPAAPPPATPTPPVIVTVVIAP
jgi:serine/threonine-protein kinase